MTEPEPALVLASASPFRRQMLENAGVPVAIDPAHVDEAEVKLSMRNAGMAVEEVAEALAELKAKRVSGRHPGTIVLGADQMLELDGDWLDKPPDTKAARAQLQRLSGKTHRLVSAVVAVRDDGRLWHQIDAARLTVRPLTSAYIDSYLEQVGAAALSSVGAYQLEGRGAQLFTRVDGDFFTVLGLPLLPVLQFLRLQGLLTA